MDSFPFVFDNKSYEQSRFNLQIFDNVASGSPQFSLKQLRDMIHRLNKKKIIIIDLRKEFHWFVYHNNDWIPFTLFEPNFLYNQSKNSKTISKEEACLCKEINQRSYLDLLHVARKKRNGNIDQSNKISIHRRSIPFCLTEEQLFKKYFSESCIYYRVPIQDHCAVDADIFKILKNIIAKHPHHWIHLHCRGGAGRTSQVLLLIDVLKNKKRFTFQEYIQREIDRGGAYLWKSKYQERLKKIKKLIKF